MSNYAETSNWVQFFECAGIPPKIALSYAKLFAEHRIQKSQLGDLHKSLLNEIGVHAVGDVLAILQYAKTESEKYSYEKLGLLAGGKVAPTKSSLKPQPNVSETSKILRTVTVSDDDSSSTSAKPAEKRQKLFSSAPANKTIRLSDNKKTVFDRLGVTISRDGSHEKIVRFSNDTKDEAPEVSSTTKDEFPRLESDKILIGNQSLFSRLGGGKSGQPVASSASTVFDRRVVVAKEQRTVKISDSSSTGSDIKSRLGGRPTLSGPETSKQPTGIFSRLGKRKIQ